MSGRMSERRPVIPLVSRPFLPLPPSSLPLHRRRRRQRRRRWPSLSRCSGPTGGAPRRPSVEAPGETPAVRPPFPSRTERTARSSVGSEIGADYRQEGATLRCCRRAGGGGPPRRRRRHRIPPPRRRGGDRTPPRRRRHRCRRHRHRRRPPGIISVRRRGGCGPAPNATRRTGDISAWRGRSSTAARSCALSCLRRWRPRRHRRRTETTARGTRAPYPWRTCGLAPTISPKSARSGRGHSAACTRGRIGRYGASSPSRECG
mmetsp:Transcript_38788/g.116591  ORF Transcript_38788/g.116591 Transcript_38788/m.116591 type:complete len:261 (+) Transcript_38788:334-1116(+)